MTKKLIIISYVVLILTIIGLVVYYNIALGAKDDLSYQLKKQLIEADNVKKLDSTNYVKVVNDLNTEKELSNILKNENNELFQKAKKYELLYFGSLQTQKVIQLDTVLLYVDKQTQATTLTDWFPTIDNPFIKYTAVIDSTNAKTEFTVYPFKLDFSIVNDTENVQRVIFNTPTWLQVEDIQIYSKSQHTALKSAKWYIGAGVIHTNNTSTILGTLDYSKDRWMYGVMGGSNLIGGSIKYNIF